MSTFFDFGQPLFHDGRQAFLRAQLLDAGVEGVFRTFLVKNDPVQTLRHIIAVALEAPR
jgi:hypothetical protein